MGRRLDRLLQALDRLDERVGFAPGGRFNRLPGRTRVGRAILRFGAWAYRRPIRNAIILYVIFASIYVTTGLLEGESLERALLFGALSSLPVWVLPLVAPAGRRRLEEIARRPREDSVDR